jgi:hypothetical protein
LDGRDDLWEGQAAYHHPHFRRNEPAPRSVSHLILYWSPSHLLECTSATTTIGLAGQTARDERRRSGLLSDGGVPGRGSGGYRMSRNGVVRGSSRTRRWCKRRGDAVGELENPSSPLSLRTREMRGNWLRDSGQAKKITDFGGPLVRHEISFQRAPGFISFP